MKNKNQFIFIAARKRLEDNLHHILQSGSLGRAPIEQYFRLSLWYSCVLGTVSRISKHDLP